MILRFHHLVHKLVSNENDSLTPRMLKIPLHPVEKSSSQIDEAERRLGALGSYMDIDTFFCTPYKAAKNHLKSLTRDFMEKRQSHEVSHYGTHANAQTNN